MRQLWPSRRPIASLPKLFALTQCSSNRLSFILGSHGRRQCSWARTKIGGGSGLDCVGLEGEHHCEAGGTSATGAVGAWKRARLRDNLV